MEHKLKNFDYKSTSELSLVLDKALNEAAANILKFLNIVKHSSLSPGSSDNVMRRFATELDQKEFQLQKDEIVNII